MGAGAGDYGKERGPLLTLVSRAALARAVDPDVALESAEKASLGLSSGDVVYDVGASVLASAELVAEAVLDLIRSGAEEFVGLLVLEAMALVVLDLEVVAFFRTHAGMLGEGDILGAGLGAVAFATDIRGAQRVRRGYRGLSDGAFKMMHDAAEAASGELIGGEAVKDLITMGDEAT